MRRRMELSRQRCVPCEGGEPALDAEQARGLAREVPRWELAGDRLARTFRLRDFAEAIAFVDAVGALAEREGHHPDLHLERYRELRIELWTHAVGGLSRNDFILAAKVDRLHDAGAAAWGAPREAAAAARDAILLRGLRASCVIGTQPKERGILQEVVLDLEVELDAAPAAASDDVSHTVDYKGLKNRILDHVARTRHQLLERLAADVVALALEEPRARAATVTVDKPGALTGASSVAVRMRRERGAA